jgi:hypothetical protein
MEFQKATKEKALLRVALVGPSGSGKTYSALTLAQDLGVGRVALIDTEHGSASKYADRFDFDTVALPRHSPADYVAAMHAAAKAGYKVLVIDSLSHAWNGRGGALEMVDAAASRSSGNSFAAWRGVTPEHNKLVDALLGYPGHLFVTMRTKTEYVTEKDDRGKMMPRKIGLAPIQRDGIEYEFDIVGDIGLDHRLSISKTRCPALDGYVDVPGHDLAAQMIAWVSDGASPAAPAAPKPPPQWMLDAFAALAVPAGQIEAARQWCREAYGSDADRCKSSLIDMAEDGMTWTGKSFGRPE